MAVSLNANATMLGVDVGVDVGIDMHGAELKTKYTKMP